MTARRRRESGNRPQQPATVGRDEIKPNLLTEEAKDSRTRVSLRLAGAIGTATLTKWRKRPGEAFKKGEALYDVETEKALIEVPATCDGIMIEPKVAEGDGVEVGQVVCTIDQT